MTAITDIFDGISQDPAELIEAADQSTIHDTLVRYLTTLRPAWQRHAACREHPVELFFPARGDDTRPAKQICATCPVLDPCRTWVLTTTDYDDQGVNSMHGVVAGMSAKARRRARQTRAAA